MTMKRIVCLVLTALLVLAIVPAASLANGIQAAAAEKAKLGLLDQVWADLEAVESQALASGAKKTEVVLAVYKAALNDPRIDKGSYGDLTSKGFFFTVDGMCCSYDYRARNVEHISVMNDALLTTVTETAGKIVNTKNGPTSMNVLLVGPYYGQDGNFTNQYRNEANSIASATGGDMTELAHYDATGPAIAAAFPDCGIVIYDSHGGCMNGTSYLCLTTNAGITSQDYTNGWAYNAGSAAYIDGRYIQNHITSELPNTIVWMAICEGMMAAGHGVTGYALLEAGAGCVYGYSQSVSFVGDYEYEETFWNEMKNNNATVAEAFEIMTATHGNWDPAYSSSSGSAWPIVMSPDDPFPSNPDSHQIVNSDWQLFGGDLEPVDIEDGYLEPNLVEVYNGYTNTVNFTRIPDNANNYDLVWGSEDESIATVSGTKRRATVTGVGDGSTRIYCDIICNEQTIGRKYCNVNVLHFPTLNEAANVDGGILEFESTTPNYPWVATIKDGEAVAKSGCEGVANASSTMKLVLEMQAGETLSFRWKASCEGSSSNAWDNGKFFVNGTQYGSTITGASEWTTVTYTAASDGTYTFQWTYSKDYSVNSNDDCIYVDDVEYSGGPDPLMGDVDKNGEISSADALLLLRYVLGLQTLTNAQLAVADVDGNGVINTADALLILRMASAVN
ncbi:MAG: Ig-like domain-containing protein [Clostridia bacterium]|nr:Ig-like domain-containing protein [Clostridia bacterium]